MQKLIFEHKVSYCEVITSAMDRILLQRSDYSNRLLAVRPGRRPRLATAAVRPAVSTRPEVIKTKPVTTGFAVGGNHQSWVHRHEIFSSNCSGWPDSGLLLHQRAMDHPLSRTRTLRYRQVWISYDGGQELQCFARRRPSGMDFSIKSPSAASPLTSALASLLFLISGPRPAYGIFIPLFSFMTSIVAIYAIARRCGERLLAILTAIVVATTPLLVIYSRSFHFAMPATACTTLVLLCLIKSEQGVRWPWVIAFGVFVGLMPLARTMTVAFVPGLGVAALAYAAVAAPDERLKRVGRLAISGVVACVTSLTWLFFNGRYVADYLLSFGYGARAEEYGTKLPFASSIILQVRIFLEQTYAPHFVILLIGILLSFFLLLEKVAAPDLKKRALRSLGSPLSPVGDLRPVLVPGVGLFAEQRNRVYRPDPACSDFALSLGHTRAEPPLGVSERRVLRALSGVGLRLPAHD